MISFLSIYEHSPPLVQKSYPLEVEKTEEATVLSISVYVQSSVLGLFMFEAKLLALKNLIL